MSFYFTDITHKALIYMLPRTTLTTKLMTSNDATSIPMVNVTPTDLSNIGTARLPVIQPLNDISMLPIVNTLPQVTMPKIPVPPVTMPKIHVPSVTMPKIPVTMPKIPVPQVTIPKIPVAPVTVPKMPVSPVTVPKMPVSPVTMPKMPVSPVTMPKMPVSPVTMPKMPVSPVSIKEITLRPWQTEWAARAHNILLRNHGYIDTSRMRSGKTYVTLWLAKQFGFRLLIICPVIAQDVWRQTAAEYGVPVVDIISYQSLRSQTGHQPKHGYLNRHDNITERRIHQINFTPTRGYLDLVDQGVMVICDEIQNIKNNSAQYKACNALIRPIITSGGRSRFGLLSGTPFDKEEHAVNLLKLIGYIRAHRLYNYVRETKELVLEGMQELIDACLFINADETNRVLAEIPRLRGQMNHLCYTLYTRVVKSNLSGAMGAPTDITGRFDVKNGLFNMTANRGEELRNAINELALAVRFNERTGTADMRADNIGAVTTALVRVENAKVDDFARVATETLIADPNGKVIISVNYSGTINEIYNLLIMYNPLILNGKIPSNKRTEIVRLFNENPQYRVLLMNTAVGGVGISLYAPGGGCRYLFMSPSYKLLEITQAANRIHGPGMDSDAFVRMFYGKDVGGTETDILTAMARKTQVLRGTLEENVTRDLILPGDYEQFIEGVTPIRK